jgi:CRP/FNR family transcriptional regulator, cyclic AMP receptor protein
MIASHAKGVEMNEKKKLLRDQILFAGSSHDVLNWASNMLQVSEFKAGSYICFQGDMRSPLVLLKSGQLRISTVSEDGAEIPVGVVNPGESAGEPEIVRSSPILVNIAVVRTSTVGIFSRADARQVLNEPSISRALNGRMASQLSQLIERQASQGLPRADARISAVIESVMSNAKGGESTLIELPKQETIAAMANVSRETVSRVLKTLELRGIISKEGRHVLVRDRTALHVLATA